MIPLPRIEGGDGRLSAADRHLLVRAIELGRKGWGLVHPNPMVGAVLARRDGVLAEGLHARYGGPHAEVAALAALEDAREARGATMYCSLEPCNHFGKTPPCTEAILAAGVARVVFWAAEPGAVAGGGADRLRGQGVVVDGPFGEPAEWAAENPFFFRHAAGRGPCVALKLAMSLDGRIAPRRGRRVWLTGEASRREVHRLRAGFDALMVGTRTWQADDPMLTVRGEVVPRRPPVAVLLDRRGQVPRALRAFGGGSGPRAIVATAPDRAEGLARRLDGRADVLAVPARAAGLDLAVLLRALAERGVRSVLCEGGGVLAASLLREGLVDRLYLFVAPVVIGESGVPAFPVDRAGGHAPAADQAPVADQAPAADQAPVADHAAAALAFEGWKSLVRPSRFGNDTLIVLDRGD